MEDLLGGVDIRGTDDPEVVDICSLIVKAIGSSRAVKALGSVAVAALGISAVVVSLFDRSAWYPSCHWS